MPLRVLYSQVSETGTVLLPDEGDSRVINGRTTAVSLDLLPEVCGKFLLRLPDDEEEEFWLDVCFNNGPKAGFAKSGRAAYAVVTSSVPHLPTGEIVVEKDHVFRFYDVLGKFVKRSSRRTSGMAALARRSVAK